MFHSFHRLRWTQQISLLPMYGLHSWNGRAPQRWRRGHRFVEDSNFFFRVYLQLLKLQLTLRRSHVHLKNVNTGVQNFREFHWNILSSVQYPSVLNFLHSLSLARFKDRQLTTMTTKYQEEVTSKPHLCSWFRPPWSVVARNYNKKFRKLCQCPLSGTEETKG